MGELISRSEQDLLDIRNFGAKSIDEVKAKLHEMGLSLKDSAPGLRPVAGPRGVRRRRRLVRRGRAVLSHLTPTPLSGYLIRPGRNEKHDAYPQEGRPPRRQPGPPEADPEQPGDRLFEHGRITTTEAKARMLRPVAEKLITKAKKGDLHNRRLVLRTIRDKGVVHTLFTEIAPQFAERPGGYTRITKIGPRKGDNAPMAVIELVTEPYAPKARAATDGPTRCRRARAGGRGARGRGRPRRGRAARPPRPRGRRGGDAAEAEDAAATEATEAEDGSHAEADRRGPRGASAEGLTHADTGSSHPPPWLRRLGRPSDGPRPSGRPRPQQPAGEGDAPARARGCGDVPGPTRLAGPAAGSERRAGTGTKLPLLREGPRATRRPRSWLVGPSHRVDREARARPPAVPDCRQTGAGGQPVAVARTWPRRPGQRSPLEGTGPRSRGRCDPQVPPEARVRSGRGAAGGRLGG